MRFLRIFEQCCSILQSWAKFFLRTFLIVSSRINVTSRLLSTWYPYVCIVVIILVPSSLSNSYCVLITASCTVFLIVALLWSYNVKSSSTCGLTDVKQHDFYHYYGLTNIDNPLLRYSAEEEDQYLNRKCHLFYDFMHLLPVNEIELSKSMIVQSLRGGGKTHIRQCIISKLPQNNHLLITLHGINIDHYLNNFLVHHKYLFFQLSLCLKPIQA